MQILSTTEISPEEFIGRQDIIQAARSYLAGHARTNISIMGGVGVGKTTLLHQVRYLAGANAWGQPETSLIFFYLDFAAVDEFTPDKFWRQIVLFLSQQPLPPVIQRGLPRLLKKGEIRAFDVQRVLRRLDQENKTLVLQLDNFGSLVDLNRYEADMLKEFLSNLRAASNHLPLITASRRPLSEICKDVLGPGSPFYNNFIVQFLPPFSDQEVQAFLSQAQTESTIVFSQNDAAFLERLAGPHPVLLQIGYQCLLQAKENQASQPYLGATEAFNRQAEVHLAKFWGRTTPLEQALLNLIIILYLHRHYQFQLEFNQTRLDQILEQHNNILTLLLDRGLIKKGREEYSLFSDIFAWWILRHLAGQSKEMVQSRYQTLEEEVMGQIAVSLRQATQKFTLNPNNQSLIPKITADLRYILLGSYELQDEIGRGTSGVVYKALDQKTKLPVAVKLLHGQAFDAINTQAGPASQILLREIQAMGKLDHPNIIKIHEADEANNYIFLVMEYLEGQTLAHLLQKRGHLSLEEAVQLIKQTADALDYAHDQGVIHRDVKPANLMILPAGQIKLMDFGIAKILDDPTKSTNQNIKGTIIYMSPEQLNQEPVTKTADLYSLACITFEMLSGGLPWPVGGMGALMISMMNDAPRSLENLQVPQGAKLDPIFQKALAKDPTERYQSGQEFVAALQRVANENVQ